MKTLKFLLACVLILGYSLTTPVDAQKKSEKMVLTGSFYCYCAGEVLNYVVVFNYVQNGKIEHYNAMGGTLIGQSSGAVYRMIDSETWKTDGDFVVAARFIHKGVVRTDQFVINENHQLTWGGCGS